MAIPPEVFETLGMIFAGGASAFLGGKNSLNGFKDEVRSRFDNVDARLDVLTKADGDHESRLARLETTPPNEVEVL